MNFVNSMNFHQNLSVREVPGEGVTVLLYYKWIRTLVVRNMLTNIIARSRHFLKCGVNIIFVCMFARFVLVSFE